MDLPKETEIDLEEAPVVPADAVVSLDVELDETPVPEPDLEETQLEETQVKETPQATTEEPVAMDDDEPLEWEESDREEEPPVA